MTDQSSNSGGSKPRRGEPLHVHGALLMQQHFEAMAKGNMAGALEYWDRFAPYYFRHVITHSKNAHNYHLPSIFSSFMPKSGGTFVHNRMVHSIGYDEFFWAITNPLHAQEVWASRPASLIYTLGGFAAHCHMLPEAELLGVLSGIRDTPFWVHIRNPVDCVVASFHHYLGQAQGEGDAHQRRVAYNNAEVRRLDMDLSDIDRFSEKHLGFFIRWIEKWVDYSDVNPDDVIFSFFDELNNPQQLFARVLHQFGAECPKVSDFQHRHPNDRWRSSSDDRQVLSAGMRANLTDQTAQALKQFKHRDRLMGQ
jgi:hypothetical protein